MGMVKDMMAAMKRKAEEIQERKEFLDMVEDEAKPIRRKAYMQQMLKEVAVEGMLKAREDSAKKRIQPKKTKEDFGMSDPYKYLNTQKPKTKSEKPKK